MLPKKINKIIRAHKNQMKSSDWIKSITAGFIFNILIYTTLKYIGYEQKEYIFVLFIVILTILHITLAILIKKFINNSIIVFGYILCIMIFLFWFVPGRFDLGKTDYKYDDLNYLILAWGIPISLLIGFNIFGIKKK